MNTLAGVALLVALAAVVWALARGRRDRLHARRLRAAARRLEPDLVTSARGLDDAVLAVERAVERAAHARAEQPEGLLPQALDTISQGIVIYDGSGSLAYANEVGAFFLEARHSDALVEEAISTMAQAGLQGETDARTVELFGPPRRTLVLRAMPLETDAGRVGALVTIEDASARRRLEHVRRDFVANISHELKTPVGALGLLAETLLGEDDPHVVRRLAERLQTEAFRVGRTIDDLLELSRIEAEEHRETDAVQVHAVLAEAVGRVLPAAEQRAIQIDVDEPSHRLSVIGDRRQLVSAVFNLLENAVKYSDTGSSVDLRAATDGTWVDISVEDHGIGIPPRDLERVFERFYRVDRARSRETGGTGLGLAIVRHVTANHRGDVTVESREGVGSTFTLRLPAGPGPVAVTRPTDDLEAG